MPKTKTKPEPFKMKVVPLQEYLDAATAQGVPREHIALKCSMCGTVQSATDLIKAGAGKDFDDVEGFLGFSCVGRFTNAGPLEKGAKPGKGCDWTLGGLFSLHKLEVVTEDGKHHPRFELASPEEAQAHMKQNEAGA
jgi:hypothetical protein